MIDYFWTQKARQLSNSYKKPIMKALIFPTTLEQRQSRNAVIFFTVCTIAIVLVCIYSPNVFKA